MSSLRRGHANLLCIVPIFADDLREVPSKRTLLGLCADGNCRKASLWAQMIKMLQKTGAVRELNPRPLAPKARIIPLDQRPTALLQNMLDGIRTRNPQIRSLMRYPLRHEHLTMFHTDGIALVCI